MSTGVQYRITANGKFVRPPTTLTSEDAAHIWAAENLKPGESYSLSFDLPGAIGAGKLVPGFFKTPG